MTDEPNLAGRVLASRFDVLELVGRGGMGAVYRARDRELDELVALKVIRRELAGDPAIVDRFRSEVKLARRVTHANVARTFELGSADGVMFCTMELIDGESLTQRLRDHHKLPVNEAVAIAIALCDALTAAHAVDVIHRDIKPDNVLLASSGRVVMADFGIAAASVGRDQRDPSGTPAYMAPEQALGEPPTPAVDVYAVGVLLYEMLTGHRGFSGELTKILADKQAIDHLTVPPGAAIPAELAAVIARATARDRDQRYATASVLRRSLAPWDRPGRAPTQPQRLAPEIPEVTTVVVLGPCGDGALRYLADGVHDELIARLGRLPRFRILPRSEDPGEPGTFVVALTATTSLEIAITHDGAPIAAFHVPLAIERIDDVAEATARAINGAVAVTTTERTVDRNLEALDLMLRARHLAQTDVRRINEAMAMLERAHAHAPDQPRVAALLAISQVQLAFFIGSSDLDVFARATKLARAAVAAAPELADGHLALGHIELNCGDAAVAAGHFRVAIARAPYSADAHEQLGRMLLESGYLDQAVARLEEAIAINPNLRTARWEFARALALEQRWDEHDRLVADMIARGEDRVVARARYAWWRRDLVKLESLRGEMLSVQAVFSPGLMSKLVAVFLDGQWGDHCASLFEFLQRVPPNRRRRAFVGQLVAEAAAYSGDVTASIAAIEYAIEYGLFDLHWLDKCPVLDDVRAAQGFAPIRGRVKARAEAILDAFYGDPHVATSETALASAP